MRATRGRAERIRGRDEYLGCGELKQETAKDSQSAAEGTYGSSPPINKPQLRAFLTRPVARPLALCPVHSMQRDPLNHRSVKTTWGERIAFRDVHAI